CDDTPPSLGRQNERIELERGRRCRSEEGQVKYRVLQLCDRAKSLGDSRVFAGAFACAPLRASLNWRSAIRIVSGRAQGAAFAPLRCQDVRAQQYSKYC